MYNLIIGVIVFVVTTLVVGLFIASLIFQDKFPDWKRGKMEKETSDKKKSKYTFFREK